MNENRCVTCGAIIPEGRQVCYKCEDEEKLERAIAQICLNCDKKICYGRNCNRYAEKLTEIKRGK